MARHPDAPFIFFVILSDWEGSLLVERAADN
jgi:hypothetical protein